VNDTSLLEPAVDRLRSATLSSGSRPDWLKLRADLLACYHPSQQKRLTEKSTATILALLPAETKAYILQDLIPNLDDAGALEYSWDFWARPQQLAPAGDWFIWLLEGGRGGGKTRSAAEFVRDQIEAGEWRHPALIGRTSQDVRKIIVEDFEGGPRSGLLQVCPPWNRPKYNPGTLRLTWTNPNFKSYGATAELYSAEIEELRGPGHDGAWCDEIAAWRFRGAYDNLLFTMRSGKRPRIVVSSTPKPVPVYREIRKHQGTIITKFSSMANRENLAAVFFKQVIEPLMGTRIGRQEIEAEMLEDVEGALWTMRLLDRTRIVDQPHMDYVVIGVDPPAIDTESDRRRIDEELGRMTSGSETPIGAECGIVAAGRRNAMGKQDHHQGFVLNDYSVYGNPEEWGQAVVHAFHTELADLVVAEANNGGPMVRTVIHSIDKTIPVELVYASRNKRTRAEPISVQYEQGRVHHLGCHGLLEAQMCNWLPGDKSPDRMDAMVWALTKLLIGTRRGVGKLAGQL
jgi:phage terminase large subunit-like protein